MARLEVTGKKFISKRGVAARYDVTTRTIDRWTETKILPAPDLVINHRRYWDEDALTRHDRRRTIKAGASHLATAD